MDNELDWINQIPESVREGLRVVRLYHWRRCLDKRRQAEKFVASCYESKNNRLSRAADFHLKCVQELNRFFDTPNHDTAERDAAHADLISTR